MPLPDTTVIEALLSKLRRSFEGSCTICANGQTELFTNRLSRTSSVVQELALYRDALPCGTAGCIKACQSRIQGDVIFVAGASVWLEDDPQWMVEQHRAQGNALTVFCTTGAVSSGGLRNRHFRPTGIYCCDPSVLDFIPDQGYRDLKEQLVPSLRQAGLKVGAVLLEHETREILDWSSYLRALGRALSDSDHLRDRYQQLAPEIWVGEGVAIAPRARVIGPALLGNGCTIADDAIVFGPTILGDGSHVGQGVRLNRIIAPQGVHMPPGVSLSDRVILSALDKAVPEFGVSLNTMTTVPTKDAPGNPAVHSERSQRQIHAGPSRWSVPAVCAGGLFMVSLFVLAFWHSFVDLWQVWQNYPDYSAGQLVPIASVYMVAKRRRLLRGIRPTFSRLGVLLFSLGAAANFLGCYYLYSSLQNLGVVTCANGIVLLLLGRHGYKHIWFPMVFLFLMIPLPGRIHDAVAIPLQSFCAFVSAGLLEFVGIPVLRHGHVLEVAGRQVAVAEACNGLRMAIAFVIVAGVVAFLIRRPKWQKVVVLLSSLPIAILSNMLRVVLTASLYGTAYEWMGTGAMHEASGLLMMPVALGMILFELWLMTKLTRSRYWAPAARPSVYEYGRVPSLGDLT